MFLCYIWVYQIHILFEGLERISSCWCCAQYVETRWFTSFFFFFFFGRSLPFIGRTVPGTSRNHRSNPGWESYHRSNPGFPRWVTETDSSLYVLYYGLDFSRRILYLQMDCDFVFTVTLRAHRFSRWKGGIYERRRRSKQERSAVWRRLPVARWREVTRQSLLWHLKGGLDGG